MGRKASFCTYCLSAEKVVPNKLGKSLGEVILEWLEFFVDVGDDP